jgi:hypothetical protein
MEDDLTLAALRMALASRNIRPRLVHHSVSFREACVTPASLSC